MRFLIKEMVSPTASPSPLPPPYYSPITHLKFLLVFSPPQHSFSPPHSNSNSSINSSDNNSIPLRLHTPTTNPNVCFPPSFILATWETMRRRPNTAFLLSFLAVVLFAVFSLHLSRNAVSDWHPHSDVPRNIFNTNHTRLVVRDDTDVNVVDKFSHQIRRVSSVDDVKIKRDPFSISTVSVLLPDWEILVIVSPDTPLSPPHSGDDQQYHCLFRNGARSPAKFSAVLPFTNRTTFKCEMLESVRRRRIFSQPMLVAGASENKSSETSPAPELIRWNLFVYESFSTEDDVVLFAKGVNHRQGIDRAPKELRCVFGLKEGIHNTVRTTVTSSVQEVFRCAHPDPTELGLASDKELCEEDDRIGVSIEIVEENLVVPSVAYYMPKSRPKPTLNGSAITVQDSGFEPRAQDQDQPKYLLCACTMIYNVAKFLREWVMYHSKIGVDNFLLYDNGSDDDLGSVIEELQAEGYNISTLLWIWPKTQEAGFSHSILYSRSQNLCTWMMFVDVDEFVFSPSWENVNGKEHRERHGSHSLKSMLPQQGEEEEEEEEEEGEGGRENSSSSRRRRRIGQLSIRCNEFGPSGQRRHPEEGVTQGYTCRRRVEQRHKSMVLVEAVDASLENVIHHFWLKEKEGFWTKHVSMEEGLVNHYKYQAWDEFKSKFRRRVSAYVVDWRQAVNPQSKDRTPGLGFEPIEPEDWPHRFCEVRDHRLRSLTRAWFGSSAPNGYRMAWQTG